MRLFFHLIEIEMLLNLKSCRFVMNMILYEFIENDDNQMAQASVSENLASDQMIVDNVGNVGVSGESEEMLIDNVEASGELDQQLDDVVDDGKLSDIIINSYKIEWC